MTRPPRSRKDLQAIAVLAVGTAACGGHRMEQPPSPMTYSIIVVNGEPVTGGGWPPTGGRARAQLYAWVGPVAARRDFGWIAPEGVLCIVTDASLAASVPANHWELCLQPARTPVEAISGARALGQLD